MLARIDPAATSATRNATARSTISTGAILLNSFDMVSAMGQANVITSPCRLNSWFIIMPLLLPRSFTSTALTSDAVSALCPAMFCSPAIGIQITRSAGVLLGSMMPYTTYSSCRSLFSSKIRP